MGWYPAAIVNLPLSGGTLTGVLNSAGIVNTGTISSSSVISANGGTSSSGSAPILTPANSNGTAAQLSDHTRDYMIYLTVGTAGTTFVLAMGPTVGVANTLVPSSAAASGQQYDFRLPAGWFWEWSATTATLASQIAVGC